MTKKIGLWSLEKTRGSLPVKMVVPGQDTSPAGTSGVGSPKGPTSGTTWEATAEMVDVFWRMFLFSTIQLKRKGPSDDRKAVLGFGWDLGNLFSCQTQQVRLIFQPEFSFTTYGCFETTKDEGFTLLIFPCFFLFGCSLSIRQYGRPPKSSESWCE